MRLAKVKADLPALQKELTAAGWQPIETAPKDGRWILLNGGKTTEAFRMEEDHLNFRPAVAHWAAEDCFWATAYWDSDWRDGYEAATHWKEII